MRRIEVTASTMGQSNPFLSRDGKPYRYQGDPTWTPNDPRYRDTIPRSQFAGGEARTARRAERLDAFAAILAENGYPDPGDAPNLACIEAGKQLGVGEKTSLSYRTALKKQQRGEDCDE